MIYYSGMSWIIAIALIALIWIMWQRREPDRVLVCSATGGTNNANNNRPSRGVHQCWPVIEDFPDQAEAAALLTVAHKRMLRFLAHLRDKYMVDLDDETREMYLRQGKIGENHTKEDRYLIISAILAGYDPVAIYENSPTVPGETSYNVNKGERLVICLRSRDPPHELVDINTLMYVMLHEVGGHIGAYDVWGHPQRFWSIFKFILAEAVHAGVYRKEDYEAKPVWYCGLKLDYQPLDDPTLPSI